MQPIIDAKPGISMSYSFSVESSTNDLTASVLIIHCAMFKILLKSDPIINFRKLRNMVGLSSPAVMSPAVKYEYSFYQISYIEEQVLLNFFLSMASTFFLCRLFSKIRI